VGFGCRASQQVRTWEICEHFGHIACFSAIFSGTRSSYEYLEHADSIGQTANLIGVMEFFFQGRLGGELSRYVRAVRGSLQ
jgi:hypothetical protein